MQTCSSYVGERKQLEPLGPPRRGKGRKTVARVASEGALGPAMVEPMEIREATNEDWPQLWPIYDAIVSAGETYAYPQGLEADARALWMERPPGHTVVAVEAGQVVGTAKMGPNRPGRGDHVATASFMVAPAHHGRGVGRALGEYALAWAKAQGYLGMQFNAVVERNAAAVHLWRSLGFAIIGTVPEAFRHPVHGLVGLHLMWRRL